MTVDTAMLGWRERDLRNAYLPFVLGEGLANYFSDPVFQKRVGGDPRANPARAIEYFLGHLLDTAHTWDDFGRLCRSTRLPVLLKGLLDPDDARKAVEHGAAGVIVSNHGGRQLDGAIASLDALPRVVEAIGERATVLFDSGIRRGTDVFKAVALGARCVLLGRPFCYGLAIGGEKGVHEVLSNLIADIDLTLAPGGMRLVCGGDANGCSRSPHPGSIPEELELLFCLRGPSTVWFQARRRSRQADGSSAFSSSDPSLHLVGSNSEKPTLPR